MTFQWSSCILRAGLKGESRSSIPATQNIDSEGRKGVRIHFYLEGVRRQSENYSYGIPENYWCKNILWSQLFVSQAKRGGTVFLDAKEDPEGKMQTCHLVVQVLINCPSWPPSDFLICVPFRWMGTLWLWWITDRGAVYRVHSSGLQSPQEWKVDNQAFNQQYGLVGGPADQINVKSACMYPLFLQDWTEINSKFL